MTVRMRHTKSHRNNRRSHHALKVGRLSKCNHCGFEKLPHVICANCGWYNDRQVIDVLKKLDKKERKKKEKELEGAKEEQGSGSLEELSRK
ncbi:50S ribosomal protein L32 [Candidatus Giovannonibacteria bacterium]|nr:50S ribosomal protein L32 [Candidatus Giovannonibacteria bacterium]